MSITIGYLAISFLHIVVGELIPKSIAIRRTEKSALFISYPITFFRFLFFVPIWVLNSTVNVILKIFKIPVKIAKDRHSEDEVRVILDQSQSSGVMSFRRLLYIENVLDLGNFAVRNAMRQRESVCTISTGSALEDVNRIITKNKFSRYPLIDTITSEPIGFVHVKDLYHAIVHTNGKFDISDYLRPALKTTQDEPLEKLMASMQRKGNHMATVHDSNNAWLGIITLEDAIEEVIGTIEEEYPIEQLVHLSDFLRGSHLLLGIKGTSIITAVRNALHSINQKELPIIVDDIISHIADRERIASTYVGHRLAIPHARLTTISQPIVIVVKLKNRILVPGSPTNETINLLFVLLTPANSPRIHQILLSHIAGIFESDYLESRLGNATTSGQLDNVIITAEQPVLA